MGPYGTRRNTKEKKVELLTIPSGADPDASSKKKRERKTHERVKTTKKTKFKETIESVGLSVNTETTTADDEQVKKIKKDFVDGIVALRGQSKIPATTPPAFPSIGKKPASEPKLPSMKFDPLSPTAPVLSPVLMRAATESAANKKDPIEQALLTQQDGSKVATSGPVRSSASATFPGSVALSSTEDEAIGETPTPAGSKVAGSNSVGSSKSATSPGCPLSPDALISLAPDNFRAFLLPQPKAEARDYAEIDKMLSHPVLTSFRNLKDRAENDFPVLSKGNGLWFTSEDYERCIEPKFSSNAMIDLATLWGFRGAADSKFYAAPCRLFNYAAVSKNRRKDWSQDSNDCKDCLNPVLNDGPTGLFSKSVIDITVHYGEGDGHFSKAFVVNIDKFFIEGNGQSSDDPLPCILFCDSCTSDEGYSSHSEKAVAEHIRYLLNTAHRYISGGKSPGFTKKSLPSFTLNGKFALLHAGLDIGATSNYLWCCDFLVPQQQQWFSCGLNTLLMRSQMLQAMQDDRLVTFDDVDDCFDIFTLTYFEYENKQSAMRLQEELGKLAAALSILRTRVHPGRMKGGGTPVAPQKTRGLPKTRGPPKAPKIAAKGTTKKKKRPAVAFDKQQEMKQMENDRRKAKAQVQTASMAGKLGSASAKPVLQTRKTYDRRVGEHASSIKQTKDSSSRRALCKFAVATDEASLTMSHGDSFCDTSVPRPRLAGIVLDEVVPRPDRQSFDHKCRRDSPLRLVFGCRTKEELLVIGKDIVDNVDKYQFPGNEYEADKLVFGEDRMLLDHLLRKKIPIQSVEEKEENQPMVEDVKVLAKTPAKEERASKKTTISEDF